ncbi:metallophosphoesterase [uncultured Brachyspira sp.]|uniref:metallophosphoesterase n=1 Tax=uncultured Brachyspira sp. TaxID=221953 RepID=UPI00261209D1|nr:metallophosphoesterase [uncultured Brachyspira sp.]
MIYFTSDTHFNSYSIVNKKKCFKNLEEMHEKLINNWNNIVSNEDEIYILGDFSNEKGYLKTENVISKLNGKKYLIAGNNDNFLKDKNFNRDLFIFIKDYHFLSLNMKDKNDKRINIVLFHYPIYEWEGMYKGTIHIHGHIHRNVFYNKKAFNVSSNIHNFYPVSLEKILKELKLI